jgi:hypothetical protein
VKYIDKNNWCAIPTEMIISWTCIVLTKYLFLTAETFAYVLFFAGGHILNLCTCYLVFAIYVLIILSNMMRKLFADNLLGLSNLQGLNLFTVLLQY